MSRWPTTPFAPAPGQWDARRRIAVRGMFNLRDVGGYPTSDGGTTRWRMLLRGDAPHRLTDDCHAVLDRIGLRSVVDLRSQLERDLAPAAWGNLPVTVRSRPVLSAVDPALTLEDLYEHMTSECAGALTGAVVEISRTAGSPTLVHCSAGKDRTGVVIALVLAVVGVGDPDIVADYALTSRYLNPRTPVAVRQLAGGDRARVPSPAMLACPPRLLADTLRRLRRDHGGVQDFLLDHGATPADLRRLREHLVAPAS